MSFQSQKRIALISVHGDPAAEIGKEEAAGQNVYVRQVGEALAKLGWDVDMFTRWSQAEDDPIVEHGPHCRTFRLEAGPKTFIPRHQLFEYLPEFVKQVLKFEQEQGVEYPLIHTNYWLSSWVGMSLKKHQAVKQVHTYHSLGAVKYRSIPQIPDIAQLRLTIEKECLETADTIVATSPQEKADMLNLVSTKGKIEIIPCGTDIQRFGSLTQQQARHQLGISLEEKVIFFVGRFDPRKGIDTLIQAVNCCKSQYQNHLTILIGGGSRPGFSDGNERERLEKLVTELGMNQMIKFLGRIEDEDLPLYYGAADVCVFPSHYEPFGLVAIEAMASGTPVIVSDVGGLRFTVVPEQTGLLCPPKDEIAFAQAIDRILLNPTWRDQLGTAARERVEHKFSWTGVALQLNDLYSRLLE